MNDLLRESEFSHTKLDIVASSGSCDPHDTNIFYFQQAQIGLRLGTNLVGVGETTHARHDAEHVVVDGVDSHLGGLVATDGVGRHNKLERRVVDAREVARASWLVLFWAKRERVDVDTGVWVGGVVLVWLDQVEVSSEALREPVLAVELELGGDNRVLSPAVHAESSLGEHNRACR